MYINRENILIEASRSTVISTNQLHMYTCTYTIGESQTYFLPFNLKYSRFIQTIKFCYYFPNVGLPASLETDRCFDPLAKLMAGVTEQAADADPKIGRRMSVKELKLADRVFGVVSRRSKFLRHDITLTCRSLFLNL